MATYSSVGDLSTAVVEHLKRVGGSCSTLDIAKAVGMTRKEINHIIYELQSRGALRRVQQSPPVWELVQDMRGSQSLIMKLRGGATRMGRGRGRGLSLTPPAASSNYTRRGRGRSRGRSFSTGSFTGV